VPRSAFPRHERGLIAAAAFLVFSRVFAFSLVLPGFRAFGATLTGSALLVGMALGAYGLTMAVAQLANGWLSDHVGRRPVLLVGSLLFVLGSAWAAVAHSIWTLLAARLLQGLGGVSSVAMAAVGETVPEERRTSAMALVGVPAGLGFFLGFILGPILQGVIGFRGLFWMMAILGAVAALPMALRALPPPAPPPTHHRIGLPVLSLALAGFTINFGMTSVSYFLPAVGHTALGLVLLGALVVMGIASRAVDRHRAVAGPVAASLLVLAAGAALFTLRGGWLLLAGGLAFFAAHATLSAILPSQVSRLAGRTGGRGHGVQLVVAYLGTSAGGTVAGAAAELASRGRLAHGAAASAAVLAVLALLVAGLAWLALRHAPARAPVNAAVP
jgi:predicted MFS family arabinose efflux permease